MTAAADYPLRPFLSADTLALRELFAQSIEELTQDDYDDDQRIAWVSVAEDAGTFGARLGGMLTLVVEVDGDYLGFAALKDNTLIDMLFVHPHYAGEGVGTALTEALEAIARARGAGTISADASDSAAEFFERLGYQPIQRNTVLRDDQWLQNTTMTKSLKPADKTAGDKPDRKSVV